MLITRRSLSVYHLQYNYTPRPTGTVGNLVVNDRGVNDIFCIPSFYIWTQTVTSLPKFCRLLLSSCSYWEAVVISAAENTQTTWRYDSVWLGDRYNIYWILTCSLTWLTSVRLRVSRRRSFLSSMKFYSQRNIHTNDNENSSEQYF